MTEQLVGTAFVQFYFLHANLWHYQVWCSTYYTVFGIAEIDMLKLYPKTLLYFPVNCQRLKIAHTRLREQRWEKEGCTENFHKLPQHGISTNTILFSSYVHPQSVSNSEHFIKITTHQLDKYWQSECMYSISKMKSQIINSSKTTDIFLLKLIG